MTTSVNEYINSVDTDAMTSRVPSPGGSRVSAGEVRETSRTSEEPMKQVSERWFVDDNGFYWLRCSDGSYRLFGPPRDEEDVLREVREGRLGLKYVTEVDGFKIYHAYTKDSLPIAHIDILVRPREAV